MKICTPNFDKHSFSSPKKEAPKKLKSIGTLMKKTKSFRRSFEFWANLGLKQLLREKFST
jgi:hypothetical protein